MSVDPFALGSLIRLFTVFFTAMVEYEIFKHLYLRDSELLRNRRYLLCLSGAAVSYVSVLAFDDCGGMLIFFIIFGVTISLCLFGFIIVLGHTLGSDPRIRKWIGK